MNVLMKSVVAAFAVRHRWFAILAVLALALYASMLDAAYGGTVVHERRVLTVNGKERSYALYVPASVRDSAPLVVSLHGMYGTIYSFYKMVDGVETKVEQENAGDEGVYYRPNDRSPFRTDVADSAGCIAVYPQGVRRFLLGGWNYGWQADGADTDDMDFFKAIIEDVADEYKIDRKRIYCCGFSNGGMMTYACTTIGSDVFAAFASISGFQLNEFHLRATGARPVPFLHIHGMSDGFVKYSLMGTIRDMMVARNGCNPVPATTVVNGRYTKSVYSAGKGGMPYVYYECVDMGHNDYTSRTDDGNSAQTMWNFMSAYTLDSACDANLKWRVRLDEPGWSPTEHGWTVDSDGKRFSYGAGSGENNVYRSVQLEDDGVGYYTMRVSSKGSVNGTFSVKLEDVADGTKVLLDESGRIGVNADWNFSVDTYRQCKITVVKGSAEDEITDISIFYCPAAATVENLSIDGSVGKLASILTIPDGATDDIPIVIFCHGFRGDKNADIGLELTKQLLPHGIATMRFDFNGHGDSEGEFVNMTVLNEIEDAIKVYEYVRARPEFGKIAFAGHSQGGVVAAMTAGRLGSEKVSGLALFAAAAVLKDDALNGNFLGHTFDPKNPPEYVDFGDGCHLGRNFILTAQTLPIYETAAKYRGGGVVINGESDGVVTPKYGKRLHGVLVGSTLNVIPGADHGLGPDMPSAVAIATDYFSRVISR